MRGMVVVWGWLGMALHHYWDSFSFFLFSFFFSFFLFYSNVLELDLCTAPEIS